MSRSNKFIKSIVTINRTTQRTFELKGNEISVHDLKKSNRAKEFYISYIPFKDIVMTTVEIPRTVEEDEVPDAIVIKVYEDLALDTAQDYKITYLESHAGSNDTRLFNVFVVNEHILINEFDPIASQTGYIDYVAMAPFLPEALYKRNVLSNDTTDCFVYLQKDDAFLVVYQYGEYFQSRQLRYNLKYLNDKFSELVGNRMDEQAFADMLSKHGVNIENPVERDSLLQVFDDMFFYIGDIISGINKIYNVNIQNVYFGSDIGKIPGVEAFIEDRLNLIYKDFNFSIALNVRQFDITQIDIMMMMTAQDYLLNQHDEYNYSPFKRPPPFAQRPSGKLIGVLSAALLIGFIYPAYQYGHGFFYQAVTDKKSKEFTVANNEVNRIKGELANLQKQIEEVIKKVEEQNTLLSSRRDLLTAMYNKKVNYPMKSVAIYDLTNMVNNKEGTVHRIVDDDRNLTISVRAKTDKKMTELLKDISDARPYAVTTKAIVLDENNKSVAYESNVSVEIK